MTVLKATFELNSRQWLYQRALHTDHACILNVNNKYSEKIEVSSSTLISYGRRMSIL